MSRDYDLVIVGGGIHGVGVAQAAAAAGHSVLLLEQSALAAGASSCSSKLIHGGLRYLESLQFALVRESLAERRRLLQLAPDLVRLVPFYIPVYPDTRRRPWQIRTGLSLYALLTGLAAAGRFTRLPRKRYDELGGLQRHDLQAVFCYQDAQTDDAALTRAVMRSATDLGAELQTPARFLAAIVNEYGVEIEYTQAERKRHCQARVLINAAGAWVNQVLTGISPLQTKREIDLVQGTHIVVPKITEGGIFYMEVPDDGRAVFAMPRGEHTLVGTTEREFNGDPAKVKASEEEQAYLLRVLAHYFSDSLKYNEDPILDSFAGLRVLPQAEGRAFDRSRETVLHSDRPHKPRLLSIYGGKLTTYRATAEKIMRQIQSSLPTRKALGDTRHLPLTAED